METEGYSSTTRIGNSGRIPPRHELETVGNSSTTRIGNSGEFLHDTNWKQWENSSTTRYGNDVGSTSAAIPVRQNAAPMRLQRGKTPHPISARNRTPHTHTPRDSTVEVTKIVEIHRAPVPCALVSASFPVHSNNRRGPSLDLDGGDLDGAGAQTGAQEALRHRQLPLEPARFGCCQEVGTLAM